MWRRSEKQIRCRRYDRRVNCSVTFVLGNVVGNDNVWWTGDTIRRYPSFTRVNNRVQRRPCLTSNRSGLRRFVLCVHARHTIHAPSNDLVWKSGKNTTEKNIIKHVTNWIQYITRIIYIHTHSLCISLPGRRLWRRRPEERETGNQFFIPYYYGVLFIFLFRLFYWITRLMVCVRVCFDRRWYYRTIILQY